MKKIIFTLVASMFISGAAFADGSAFTPLNFNDTSYGTTSATSAGSMIQEEAIGNGNIQNAISQLTEKIEEKKKEEQRNAGKKADDSKK